MVISDPPNPEKDANHEEVETPSVTETPKSSFQALRERWEKMATSPASPSSGPPPVPPRRTGLSPVLLPKVSLYQSINEGKNQVPIIERRNSIKSRRLSGPPVIATEPVLPEETQTPQTQAEKQSESDSLPTPLLHTSTTEPTPYDDSPTPSEEDVDTPSLSEGKEAFAEDDGSDSDFEDSLVDVSMDEGSVAFKEIAKTCERKPHSFNVDLKEEVNYESLNLEKPPQEVFCPTFSVFKFNAKKQVFSKKTRLWEIDMITGELRNMDHKRNLKKKHHIDNILMFEKRVKDPLKIRLTLSDSNRTYELVFKTAVERERFFQCLTVLKKSSLVWTPDSFWKEPTSKVMESTIHGLYDHLPYKSGSQTVNTSSSGSIHVCSSREKYEPITLFTGTWNMANLPPPDENNMKEWIPTGMDIYAIALQESDTRLDALAYLNLFKKILGEGYVSIGYSSLWAIRLFVFSKETHTPKISCVEVKQKPTGFLQICGNKGGIGLSMKFNETSFCFISSHLAAKEENFDRRNGDIYGISGSLALGVKGLDITQFNHVFWCGDLNYRLDLPYEEAVYLAQEGCFDELLETDQLAKQKTQGFIFNEWNEGSITFKPTYKYKEGTNEYAETKFRPPSYCDRILWTSHPGCNAALVEYTTASGVLTSDHKPVRAVFSVNTQLPFIDYFSPKCPQRKIVFTGVYISGRSGTLLKKPQLSFYSDCMVKSPMTSNMKELKAKLVNPSFNDDALPVITPISSHQEYLLCQNITILIREVKKKGKSDDDELIGQCTIGIPPEAFEKPCRFKAPISLFTRRVGHLIGYIQVLDE